MLVRYFITSLKLQFYLLQFVVVVLIKRQNLIFFLHCPKYVSPRKKIAFCCCSFFSNEWSRYLDSQNVNFFLFGSSHLSTEENVELFFYAQQFIKESKRFCFFILKALFTRDVICMLHVKCRCKPSRWVLQWVLGQTYIKICFKKNWPSRNKGLFL